MREGGISLWLAALNPEPVKVIERSPLGKTLGHECMFFNLEQAFKAFPTYSKQKILVKDETLPGLRRLRQTAVV